MLPPVHHHIFPRDIAASSRHLLAPAMLQLPSVQLPSRISHPHASTKPINIPDDRPYQEGGDRVAGRFKIPNNKKRKRKLEEFLLQLEQSQQEESLKKLAARGGVGLLDYERRIPHSIGDDVYNAIVKIKCTESTGNFATPWQTMPTTRSSASGFVIDGKMIMTNAHAVTNATMIQVKLRDRSKWHTAKVAHINHDADLCVLTVRDKEFWEGTTVLVMDGIPSLQDEVIVVGYPAGGEHICLTKGVVSRRETIDYCHSWMDLFGIQIDAPINEGNSGGPVLMGDKVVGVAFMGLDSLQNCSYMIPTPVISHFISSIKKKGKYMGMGWCGFMWERVESKHMCQKLGLKKKDSGVRIVKVYPTTHAGKVLKLDDVVVSIDGLKINSDGTLDYVIQRKKGRGKKSRDIVKLRMNHVANMRLPGERVKLTIVRKKQKIPITLKLADMRTIFQLVPMTMHDQMPSFFVFAGMVFTKLSLPYLSDTFGDEWPSEAPSGMVQTLMSDNVLKKRNQEVVILSSLLDSDLTIGYDYGTRRVTKINGKTVNNLKDVVKFIENDRDRAFLEVRLGGGSYIVLETKKAWKQNKAILRQYEVSKDRSADLKT